MYSVDFNNHVRFEGNDIRRWDGKVISVDGAWMKHTCGEDLHVGTLVNMPWQEKEGKTVMWSEVECRKNLRRTIEARGIRIHIIKSFCFYKIRKRCNQT